ncbi:MAG: PspA/IM30 family protein [Paracoccaceae bacterium]|nr:PspA/IM30 family protein [Paracoccaceae bacterium]MDG1738474.1 PspA/IM30 family protein [Paracoccaceae bacterium]MDG2259779.1 PspA/IM30 family protein [Paracoccaceae bacterium]
MFKQIMTLARGRVSDGSQSILDANSMSLLRQQIRDAAQGVGKSRKAVAVIMAHAEREKASLTRVESQIADLENRALRALENGREDLASEAAEAIAKLEIEHSTTQKAIATYETQIERLKVCLTESEHCLRDMKQGQYLAEAKDKAQRLSGLTPSGTNNDLKDAATTLKNLQKRQEHADATAAALVELSIDDCTEDLVERMAAVGCGTSIKPDASSVMERLKNTASK